VSAVVGVVPVALVGVFAVGLLVFFVIVSLSTSSHVIQQRGIASMTISRTAHAR
jgi:hypothetical protein